MDKLFEYQSPDTSAVGNRTVLLEYGETFCCWAVWDKQAGKPLKIQYFTFQSDPSKNICNVIDLIRQETGQLNSITTCSFFPQAVLIPSEYSGDNKNFAATVYTDKYSTVCNDTIQSKRMVASYLIPPAVYTSIKKNFPHSPLFHAYTPFLKQVLPAADEVSLHFIPGACKIMVNKGGRLQLAQIYSYTASLDIVYIVLKVMQETGVAKDNAALRLSGLIEKDSALYQELYAYFLSLDFISPEGRAFEGVQQPTHYFTSIANLAACVS